MIIMICIIRYILWYIWYDICFYYYNISPKILYWISWLSMVFPHLISLKFELFFQSLFCGSSSASFACLFFLSGFAAFWFSIYHHPHLYAQIFALYCGFSPTFPTPTPLCFAIFPLFWAAPRCPLYGFPFNANAAQRNEPKWKCLNERLIGFWWISATHRYSHAHWTHPDLCRYVCRTHPNIFFFFVFSWAPFFFAHW